jgi:Protein of unknown function (DUF2855)
VAFTKPAVRFAFARDAVPMTLRSELQVKRASIGETRVVTANPAVLAEGQVRLAVEHFALTANNVTYAQFGDMLDYWNFYPVDAEWGLVPAMGWARIIQSNVVGLAVGTRYYSWYPMATTVDIRATPTRAGFRDDGPHRSQHAGAYRNFQRTDLDGLYTTAADEHRHELLRGLYLTGFLIDRFFAAQNYLGAEQAIVMSASSKTALGYASCARASGRLRTVGVTSESNRDFVNSVGLYDQVVSYAELERIETVPSVVVDMAGAGAAVAAVHGRLADRIGYSMIVGKSHHDAAPAPVPAGPQPELFFAPTAMDSSLSELGAEEYAQQTRNGLASFIESSHAWLTLEHRHGPTEAASAWRQLHAGEVGPNVGLIVSIGG